MTNTATRTGIDTRTLAVGDIIAWSIWDGTEARATITRQSEFSYSRVSADGYAQSIDHHWDRKNHYRVVGRIEIPRPSFVAGRWTFDQTAPATDRTDAVQVAMFAVDTVDQPSLFGAL